MEQPSYQPKHVKHIINSNGCREEIMVRLENLARISPEQAETLLAEDMELYCSYHETAGPQIIKAMLELEA